MPELAFSQRPISRSFRLPSLEAALPELDKLRRSSHILLSPGWDLPHTLDHCARSVEHAMNGFPVQKNSVFQALVGNTAFHLFDTLGYMRHNLDEEIPGDTFPQPPPSLQEAIDRLERSIHTFLEYQGTLGPHFAYGSLTKSQYDRANALHIANHLSAVEY